MRLPEFLVSLFTRTGLVDMTTLTNLKVELSEQLNTFMESLKNKELKNSEIENQAKELESQLDNLKPGTPEYDQVSFKLDGLYEQAEQPTLIEKVVSFFEKPWVRFALLALSVILTRYIMKKLNEPAKPEPEEEQEPEEIRYHQQAPPPGYGYYQQPWQPYGYDPRVHNQRK